VSNVGNIESKFKWEFGKVNKAGRLYASGQWLTLYDHVVCPLIKYVMQQEIYVGQGWLDGEKCDFYLEFCDCQEPVKCDNMYSSLLNLPRNVCKLVFFSDDGFIIYKNSTGIQIYETDFSSCDATNGFAIFTSYAYLSKHLGLLERAVGIIRQCGFPTLLRNPDKRSEFVELQPTEGFMYSGNNGTTGFNNIAEIGFFSKLFDLCQDPQTRMSSNLIRTAADLGGWVMTVDQRPTFNRGTFLKRAFCPITRHSWLCYGAILRSFGSVDGVPNAELLGVPNCVFRTMSLAQQMDRLILMKAESLVNEPPSPLVDAIRIRAGLQKEPREYIISYQQLNERYGTEEYQWYSLINCILNLRLGDIVVDPVLELVYNVDYGSEISEIPANSVAETDCISVFDRCL